MTKIKWYSGGLFVGSFSLPILKQSQLKIITKQKNKAMKIIVITNFSFWKNNKKDQFFQLSDEEVAIRFRIWMLTKDREFLEHYGIETATRIFITEDLSAVGKESEFPDLVLITKQVFIKTLYHGTIKEAKAQAEGL